MLKVKTEDVENIISEVADAFIIPHFRHLHAHEIHFKSDDNPVTIADSEAEAALSELLMALLPGSKVLGEEAFNSNPSLLNQFSESAPVWTIDPVDGTKAFITGVPHYGVIVSLTYANETIAGWLYDPSSHEFVIAEKGAGAFYKGQRLSVLSPDTLENMTGVMGARLIDEYERCSSPKASIKPKFERMISSCHDYARLVVGVPHFSHHFSQMHFHCWKQTCTPWDNAAGVLINTESGGYTAHWNEESFKPSHLGRGILTAPDRESWLAIRAWIRAFCTLPET